MENGDEDSGVLPGMRFHPTDQELVDFYLRRKVEKRPAKIDLIRVVDVYKFEPWDLPSVTERSGDKEWYFFCRRGRKYKNSVRPNRVTGSGFWKATGIDKKIYGAAVETEKCIGLKKSLVYYRGTAGKGTKTDWMMHEFRLPVSSDEAEVWTLCRILKREASYKKHASPSRRNSPIQSDSDSSSKMSSYSHEFGVEYVHDGQFGFLAGNVDAPLIGLAPAGRYAAGSCDELRPMVESAFDYSLYSAT